MVEHEPLLRLAFFLGVLAVLGTAERLWPRRARSVPALPRWFNNLLMLGLGSLLLRVALPMLAVAWAAEVQARGWGLFNHFELPPLAEGVVVVVLLDFAIYLQHRLMHAMPWLWRLHRVHHSDLDFDVSTGVRFHPVEILFSMLIKLGVVTTLGASPVAVLVFEILLNASSLFEHANLNLPIAFDRGLRLFLVTPDMHRVHHSAHREETDSNFGFNLSLWDRLLGTYHAQPRDGHLAMTIGLHEFRSAKDQNLLALLKQPASRS